MASSFIVAEVVSMSRAVCHYDNACTESFFSSAKKECIYRNEYANIEEVKQDLFKNTLNRFTTENVCMPY